MSKIIEQRLAELISESSVRALRANEIGTTIYQGILSLITTRLMAPGDVIYCAATNRPAGAIKANGAVVSRTKYAALFRAIGVKYGAGDGATTFQLPTVPDAGGINAYIVT